MTQESASSVLEQILDLTNYPLHLPESGELLKIVETVRSQLVEDGCSILPNFVRRDGLVKLQDESREIAHRAYFQTEIVNAYNIAPDQDLPADHPARFTMERGNGFVPRDTIPDHHIIQKLYASTLFQSFIAQCFSIENIYELADPLAGLCLNILEPGKEHPWHYDTNEFTVSMITNAPQSGGSFEYSPNVRSPENENFKSVSNILHGKDRSTVKSLNLKPGDLQLFMGRFSLHRVTRVDGPEQRHSAIFAYSLKPGIIGSAERARQIFGRALPAHEKADEMRVRNDALLD